MFRSLLNSPSNHWDAVNLISHCLILCGVCRVRLNETVIATAWQEINATYSVAQSMKTTSVSYLLTTLWIHRTQVWVFFQKWTLRRVLKDRASDMNLSIRWSVLKLTISSVSIQNIWIGTIRSSLTQQKMALKLLLYSKVFQYILLRKFHPNQKRIRLNSLNNCS